MHTREHDGEIEAPTLVPSHRHVKNGVTTGKITRCRKSEKGAAEWKESEAAHTHTHTHTLSTHTYHYPTRCRGLYWVP